VSIPKPTIAEVSDLAAEVGLDLTKEALPEWTAILHTMLSAYDELEALDQDEFGGQPSRRDIGRAPTPDENPLGAWCWKVTIRGAESGPLRGMSVAVKDNIAVQGVPLTHGSTALQGYSPSRDATVVERTLSAGGTILGMATCEAFCVSGGSHTSAGGPVRNPYDHRHTSGGSSSGAAALVASGDVDLAIASDQGGSIRGPAAWCGVIGLKPTFGLVPYTGAIPGELTVDHLGPIARDVDSLALYLGVLAGPDGWDPRQRSSPAADDYYVRLDDPLTGVRIGVVAEGFGLPELSEEVVDHAVLEGAHRLARPGIEVEDISLPFHLSASAIRSAIMFEGTAALIGDGYAVGTNRRGRYEPGLARAMAEALESRADELPETLLTLIMAGRWGKRVGRGEFYAHARHRAELLGRMYDEALSRFDLLVMPTVPMRAPLLTQTGGSLTDRLRSSRSTGINTAPFNLTGHPVVTVPCAVEGGLPIGMMLVGQRGNEALLLRVARLVEREIFRMPPPPGAHPRSHP
jgi:amidase